ncbi:MAG: hypothetical protein JXR49_07275 [Acidobacteria bacterium]|nr:hypothetical protein [Acidobacteriota bacterium]
MAKVKAEPSFPDRRISETFLEFAEPLFGSGDEAPTKEQLETILKVAFTVWNSVVLDTVNGNSQFVKELRRSLAGRVIPSGIVEGMISRKKSLFGNDHRMIGNFHISKKNGEWRLWAEARKPPAVN